MQKVILTTGGTGGHIFPAIAVAEELQRRFPKLDLLFVGSSAGPEERIVTRAGLPFYGFPVAGVRGRGRAAFAAIFSLARAVKGSLGLLRAFSPDVVVGFGGYASFAPMLAACLLRIPTVLHEQNAIAGTANRILGHLVKDVLISLPETRGFPAQKCIFSGNPVRSAVIDAGLTLRTYQTKHLLILGGSQGAHAINAFMVAHLPEFRAKGIEIFHQAGVKDEAWVREQYVQNGYQPESVAGFVDELPKLYQWADLCLARSGASTVAELCTVGLPAVFVPFPHAIHDHQMCNAKVLEGIGAAYVVPEKELEARKTTNMLLELLNDPAKRQEMSLQARKVARPDAAAKVAQVIAGRSMVYKSSQQPAFL